MANEPIKAIETAKQMMNSGVVYAYGFKYESINQSKINALAAKYPSNYSKSLKAKVEKKIGKIGIDCSGFVCRSFGIPHIGSSQIRNQMTSLYKPSDMSYLKNGMVIWRQGHIGLIEVDEAGVPWILEAKGTDYDLTRTLFSKRGNSFTYYGELYGVDYTSARPIGNVCAPPTKTVLRDIIDVSKYNTLDFSKVTYGDIIIRVGYRSYGAGKLTLDPKFVEHSKHAVEKGMNIGVYFYDQSINEEEAVQQADFVVGLIKPLPISYPVFLDSEYSNKNHNGRADNISKEQRTKNIVAFCERIKVLGYVPGVYASDSWFKSMVDYDRLKEYVIWCARYSAKAPTIEKYDIWQYGSSYIAGSTNPIDINHLYVDYPNQLSGGSIAVPTTPFVSPDGFCSVTASKLNVRNSPSTFTGKVVGSLNKGEKVNGFLLKGDWLKISETEEKWCSYKYIKPTIGTIVNCSKLNCRTSPIDGQVRFVLNSGDEIRVLSKEPKSGWFYVEFGQKTGYLSPKYVKIP